MCIIDDLAITDFHLEMLAIINSCKCAEYISMYVVILNASSNYHFQNYEHFMYEHLEL